MDTQSTPSTTPWTSRSAPRATTIVSDANYTAKGRNTPRTLIVVGGGRGEGRRYSSKLCIGGRGRQNGGQRDKERERRDGEIRRGQGRETERWLGGGGLGGEVDVGCVYKALCNDIQVELTAGYMPHSSSLHPHLRPKTSRWPA